MCIYNVGIRVATLIDSKFKLLMKRVGTDYYFQYPPAWDQLLLTGGSYWKKKYEEALMLCLDLVDQFRMS